MVLFVLAYAVRCVCCSRVADTGLLACERPVGGDIPRSKRGFRVMMSGVSSWQSGRRSARSGNPGGSDARAEPDGGHSFLRSREAPTRCLPPPTTLRARSPKRLLNTRRGNASAAMLRHPRVASGNYPSHHRSMPCPESITGRDSTSRLSIERRPTWS